MRERLQARECMLAQCKTDGSRRHDLTVKRERGKERERIGLR